MALARGVPPVMAAPPELQPGEIADHNRRIKGLPARFGPPLHRWAADSQLHVPGWYAPETGADGRAFRWTGPRATVRLDAPPGAEVGVEVAIAHAVRPEQLDRLVVDLDGSPVSTVRTAGAGAGWSAADAAILEGRARRCSNSPVVEVGLTVPVLQPSAVDPRSADQRLLGVAVRQISLSAAA